jgi:DNA-directed RNA polymerase specialized sigma subunit
MELKPEKTLDFYADYYFSDAGKRIKKLVDKKLYPYALPEKDYDDFYSLAEIVLVDSWRRYKDGVGNFKGFFEMCLERKIATEIRDRNRYVRKANYVAESMDAPISNDEDDSFTFHDIVPYGKTVEEVLFRETENTISDETKIYINHLSKLQRKIAILLSEGKTGDEIRKTLHITEQKYNQCLIRMRSWPKARYLKGGRDNAYSEA